MKKVILVVSFGSSMTDVISAYIEPVERAIQNYFKDYHIVRAFTSNIIRRKLTERGIPIHSPDEAIHDLISRGYEDITIQPLHIIPGFEFEKVERAVTQYKGKALIRLSTPLLYHNHDYRNVTEALKKWLPALKDNEATVLMGHGTDHYANTCYYCMQKHLEPYGAVHIANVEAIPTLNEVISILESRPIEKVYLMPFMLVAGDHAKNDMAGDNEDSWKNILLEKGFKVEVLLKALGEMTEIHHIFIEKLKNAME